MTFMIPRRSVSRLSASLNRLRESTQPGNAKSIQLFAEAEELSGEALREVRTLS